MDGLVMKKRFISAILMIMLFVPILIIGKIPFLILALGLGMIGLKELLDFDKDIPNVVTYSSYLFFLFFMLYDYSNNLIALSLNMNYLIILCLFYFISVVIIGDLKKYNYKDAINIIIKVILVGLFFKGFVVVRNININDVIYLFLISSLTDTFALLSGKYFGKHKLSLISPKKTIEGSIGGSLVGSVIASLVYWWISGFSGNFFIILVISLGLSILGQVGDLFFSSIKRTHGIKDFSNLIPGHGGIFDRFDSVSFILLGYIIILM